MLLAVKLWQCVSALFFRSQDAKLTSLTGMLDTPSSIAMNQQALEKHVS